MPIKVPDLNDLQLLVTVAATGSIGQAAAELGLTQPSASRRMAYLERSLRVELLRRGTRGSTLTPSGRAVVDWANALLRAADDFRDSVDALGQDQNFALRAAMSMTIAENYAPTWLAEVRQRSPQTNVTMSIGNSSQVMDMVESGKVDLGLIETPNVRETLRSRRIGRDDLAIAVLPDHPWATQRVGVAQLATIGLLLREPGSGTRDTVDRVLAANGHRTAPALELASNTALKSAALAGLGPVVLPAITLTQEFASGTLVEVELDGLSLSRPLTIVWADATSLRRDAVTLFLNAAQSDNRTRGRRPARSDAAMRRIGAPAPALEAGASALPREIAVA